MRLCNVLFSLALCAGCTVSYSEENDLVLPLDGSAERVCVTDCGIVVGRKAKVELKWGENKWGEKGARSVPHLVLQKLEIPSVSAPRAALVATALFGVDVKHWRVMSSRNNVFIVASDIEGTCAFEGPNNPLARLWVSRLSFGTGSAEEQPLGFEEAVRQFVQAPWHSLWARIWSYVNVNDVVLLEPGVCVCFTQGEGRKPGSEDVVWVKAFSTDPLKWLAGERRVLAGQFSRIAATRAAKDLLVAVCKRDGGLAIFSAPLEGEENKATEEQIAEGDREGKVTISDLAAATFNGEPVVLVCSSGEREPGKSRLAFYTRDVKTRQWRVQLTRSTEGSVRSASIGVVGGDLVYAYLPVGKQELRIGKVTAAELGLKASDDAPKNP